MVGMGPMAKNTKDACISFCKMKVLPSEEQLLLNVRII